MCNADRIYKMLEFFYSAYFVLLKNTFTKFERVRRKDKRDST